MIKTGKIKILAVTLSSILLLCSCAVNEDIPVLQEPVGSAPTYRPVEKGDLGESKIIIGNVVGEEYCHFYEKNVEIKSINVIMGQYVEKGDVLVEADTDSVKEQINDLNNDLKLLNDQHETDEKKYEIECSRLEMEKEKLEYEKNMGRGSDEMLKAKDKEIEASVENHTYSNQMYEFTKRKTNESISELSKIVNEGVIKAKSSGYVTYVKDLRNGDMATSSESIVTVMDPEDTYISANIDTRSYQYSKYKVKFAFVNGKKIPIEEYEYTDSEVAYSKVQNMFPVQRFKTLEETNLKLGDFVLLQFYNSEKNDVLVVGKDSFMTDDEGGFVYVRTEDGSVEKRHIEAGTTDEHNVEVVSGLEEGEWVLYTQEATLPKMEETYEVNLDTYTAMETSKGVKYVEKTTYAYFSPEKGEVDEIYVKDLDEVKKGDPLLRIVIDAEKGNLVQIENQIKKENSDYDMFVRDAEKKFEKLNKAVYDDNSKANNLRDELDEIKKLLAGDSLSDTERIGLAEKKASLEDSINELTYSVKFSEMNLKELEYDREARKTEHDNTIASLNRKYAKTKKENDGTGYKTIYAEYDGIISTISVDKGDKIKVGKKMIESITYFDNVVKFGGASDPAPFGYDFNVWVKDKKYDASVLVGNNNMCAHVFTEDGKVRSTQPPMDLKTFYVQIDDEEFYSNESQFMTLEINYDKMRIDNLFSVPGGFIFEEKSFDGKLYNYVWVLRDGEVFKRYVQTGTNQRLGNLTTPVILNGIFEGDVLVK